MQTSTSITDIQDEIVEEFSLLSEDLELLLHHLIELGEQLPKLKSTERREDTLVTGCQSKVWIAAEYKPPYIYYKGESNAAITQGLVSLLIRIYSQQSVSEILNSTLFFPQKIHMQQFIGTQRSGGFSLMIEKIKHYARNFQQHTL